MQELVPTIALVDDASFERHEPRGYHPERPERLTAARRAVAGSGVRVESVAARPATREELVRAHTPDYLDQLTTLRGKRGQLDPDTYVAPGSIDAALMAAGGACALVDALLDRAGAAPAGSGLDPNRARAVGLLRPPGHHARPAAAMGFCLLNNVAVAAQHARARGIDRVLVVDWDVHHGNGTQEIFLEDPHVLYVSLHQWPFYPGTGAIDEAGEGPGRGFTVNVPLTRGAGDEDYRSAFEQVVLPVAREFAPEIVLVSAGFDAHRLDPLAGMQLEARTYGWMASRLVEVADRFARGRIALLLEGGYDLGALEESLRASIAALATASSSQGSEADSGASAAAAPAEEGRSASGHPNGGAREHAAVAARDIERARSAAARYWSACR